MRYLRMLLNSVLAGGIAAAYLVVLFLQLNPAVPMGAGTLGRLALTLLLSYGVHFAVLFYALIVLRQLFSMEPLSPGWISFRLLVWLCLAGAALSAALMWLNLRGLRAALDDQAARSMALGALTLTLCAAMLLVLGLFRFSFGRAGGRRGPLLFAVVLAISLVVPLALRGAGHDPAAGGTRFDPAPSLAGAAAPERVTILLIDGASLDFISPAAADGRLPNFGRILDTGAVMHLATLRPTQPAPVWTAVATGKLPPRTGVRSAAVYSVAPSGPWLDLLPDYCFAHGLVSLGFLSESPHTAVSVRAKPFWAILSAAGVGVGIVRWPLTYPAPTIRGVVVSDQLHLTAEPLLAAGDPRVTYPPELVTALRTQPEPPRDAAAAAALAGQDGEPYAAAEVLSIDRLYSNAFDSLRHTPGLQVLAMRYQGIDIVGHSYLRQAMPRVFGDVGERERRRYGDVIAQYYRYLDGEVGRTLDRLNPGELLLVISAFGMEPVSLPKRLLERALTDDPLTGTHERAPDGFLLAYGTTVRPGRLQRAAVVDVTPTVLYYLGLPIGRDMDGYARTDLFARAFTSERPVTFIPSYDR